MFVLFPIVTMLLSAWLADEPLTPRGGFGAVVVMSGVWFGALSPAARQPVRLEPRKARPPAAEVP
jgi:drug/metabolite transporter (DMT)-like permease